MSTALIEAVPVPIVIVNRDRRIASLNSLARGLFGADMAGRHYMTIIREPFCIQQIEAAVDGRQTNPVELRRMIEDKERIYSLTASSWSEGGAIVTLIDQTEAHDAERMRSDFVANVSHELKTPLTALSGMIETLSGAAQNDPEARVRFLEMMAEETERMRRLVADLLSLNRIEDADVVTRRDRIDLCEVIDAARRSLSDSAQSRGVSIILKGCDAPAFLHGDADQLRQVFNNLVENAIKYGEKGGIVTIAISQEKYDPLLRGPAIRAAVSDNGRGIGQEHLARLTERFYRVDRHRSRQIGGTGLGLAIVKHIVRRHRGWLRIASKVGKGSTFTVLLPAG
ncbi:ATP-binding protein [Notoacmeibacter sp. MSK16QG-6]|uniref:ATP-binding protein n=1 Tax=Notoacmeibacter sp. MSK16QG-6 TaxID=2957982 RepID=UPI0020A11E5B|nr:ATP-binding protein [Notoacmeibacter sp. MSK16QG-6]MCP1199764.1 ATP-binding protein [Notoacmeibacter sp. MSK16QG-6]